MAQVFPTRHLHKFNTKSTNRWLFEKYTIIKTVFLRQRTLPGLLSGQLCDLGRQLKIVIESNGFDKSIKKKESNARRRTTW